MAYIIETDEAVRDSLQALVLANGWPCRVFPDGESFLAGNDGDAAGGFLFIDEGLGGMGYQAVLRELAARSSQLAAIVLTARDDDRTVARLLKAGARAVLVRPFSEADLTAAVTAALAGGDLATPT